MEKFFNTAGPVNLENHYAIPIDQRVDVAEVLRLIEQQKYFVLHAPRQSGKTTALRELARRLNEGGKYCCLYVNVEGGQTARENVAEAMKSILSALAEGEINAGFPPIIAEQSRSALERGSGAALAAVLGAWARSSPKPTVLFIDEIDSLVGDSLIAVLRQLRSGYAERPKNFPQSVILCGVRDIRDYRIHASREKEVITGGSCFNINARSLTVGNFSADQVAELYRQHTEATGQKFATDAIALAFHLTQGQPWLVNALAYEACFEQEQGRDRTHTVTTDDILAAKEALILRRVTHLDQLTDKLQEPRVRRIIEPMLEGIQPSTILDDDIQYVVDLGLITADRGGIKLANPIYQEVVPRQLTYINQTLLKSEVDDRWYIGADGSLDLTKLLTDFQAFFRENSESWIQRFDYKEAGPQLLLQAYLQRVLNGGGRIHREYGLGRGRTDLLVEWPAGNQRFVIELKIQHKSRKQTTDVGLEQTLAYMEQTGTRIGHLLIFDRTPKKPWSRKVYKKAYRRKSGTVTVWGM